MLQPPHAKDHSNTPSPHSTSPYPSLTAPRRCGPSPSTSPTLAETALRAALTASNNMSPGKATCPQTAACSCGAEAGSAWLRWHPNGDISSCCAAMGMFTWTVWAASRIRSQCVPPMTPTRRPGRAWRRQRRRLGAEVLLSLRLEAAIWVSGKQEAGTYQREVHVGGCWSMGLWLQMTCEPQVGQGPGPAVLSKSERYRAMHRLVLQLSPATPPKGTVATSCRLRGG